MRRPRNKRGSPSAGRAAGASKLHCTGNQQLPEHSPDHGRPQGLGHIGSVAAEIVARLHFRRQVERLHALGPRVTAELLAELGAERSITTIIDRKLGTFAELNPEAIEAAGGDTFWPAPIHKVQP